jgi:membrane protein DedA with SNARE-associated domain
MAGLRFRTFALFAYPGAAIWVALFLTLGYAFGERWEHTSELVHRYTLIVTAVGAALAAVVWVVRRWRRRL